MQRVHLFGGAVSLSGDHLAVGASGEDSGDPSNGSDDTAEDRGAAYVFRRSVTTWNQSAYLKSSDQTRGFGSSVSIHGGVLVVGIGIAASDGAATVFDDENGWMETTVVRADNAQQNDRFGTAVAAAAEGIAIAAPGEDTVATGINPPDDGTTTSNTGAAYAFR